MSRLKIIKNLVATSAATLSMLESDNQMQGTCFFGDFFTLVDDLELERGWKLNIQCKGVH